MTGLPASFRAHIAGAFGTEGEAWLERLPSLIEQCVRSWSLGDLVPIGELSYSWVAQTESPHGPSILKITPPNPETLTEIGALEHFRAAPVCALYAADPSRYALLLERVMPGETLWSVKDIPRRIRVASDCFHSLHGSSREQPDPGAFPRYEELAGRAFGRARNALSPLSGAAWQSALLAAIARAEPLLPSSGHPAPPLIHGDLHHGNMLSSGASWKIIDPKGIIAPVWLEPARFILNQYGDGALSDAERESQFGTMVRAFSGALEVEPSLVARGALLDAVVTACWTLDERPGDDAMREVSHRAGAVARFAGRRLDQRPAVSRRP